MTAITKCPECGTRFKVSDTQLDAHDGLVRCGRCHEVFHARKHLHDDQPSPQLSLPIEEPELKQVEEQTVESIESIPALTEDTVSNEELEQPAESPSSEFAPDTAELAEEPVTLAQQVQFIEELTDEVAEPPPRKRRWLPILTVSLLALTLLAQAAYLFRVELAARMPALKPALLQYCALLDCTVALPRQADMLSIDSSELEASPSQGNLVTLLALLHNHAPYVQAYPSLELTLTDPQDRAIARRVFHPADYLNKKAGEAESQGVAAERDFDVSMRLDTTDLNPSGYRLLLFYPQQ